MEVTLLTENTRIRYTGDGVLKEFSYPFNPIDLSYVKVYKNLQPVTAPDITISSGVVTFNTAPAEGDSIVIIREKPLTYDSGIVSKGIISPDSLDNLAVELLGQIQQVNEKLDRVPIYPIDTTLNGEDIINEFNQNVSDVKDAKISIEGKVEEINTIVSSGLTEITEATSESKTQITEEKNAAITAVETHTAPLIERAETAATEAEASRANAEEWAKSVDAENIVHRTGDESVDGRKTLVQSTIFNKELWLVDTTGGAPDNPPSADKSYGALRWIVKGTEGSTASYGGGQELWRLQPVIKPDGYFGVHISYQYGNTIHPIIFSFGCDKYGNNSFFNVPTPSIGDNSIKAANTSWVRQVAALKDLSNTGLTAGRAIITDGSGKVSVSAVTSTELGYLDGVRSNLQAQIDGIDVTVNIKSFISTVYPIGSLFFSTAGTCPLQSLGIGTWQKVGTSLTLSVNTNVPVKGNGMVLGFTNGTNTAGFSTYNTEVYFYNNPYGKNVSASPTRGTSLNGDFGVTTDASKSGIVGTVTRTQITVNVFQRTA